MHPSFRALSVGCLFPFALTGCMLSPTAAPSPDSGLAMQGKVIGGQQPIVGAHVYLFAANTTGYGGPGIVASATNASVSLLTSVPGNTALDTSGGATNGDYYVTSGAGGAFSITGDYSCTPNTQVYLYALGGNPGLTSGTNNVAAGLLAALGNCPSSGNFLATTPFIVMNEVSTIATAYALGGFATDATHVSSSGTALAKVGIANAVANTVNLESISTGAALATTPAGNGAVPQSEINTLANILATCINSTGPGSTGCTTLLNSATDTATAAINIAHNPVANISALFSLQTAAPPFEPVLSAAPNDFTLAINFTGGGLSDPYGIAIDSSGDVWVTNFTGASLSEFSPNGAPRANSPFSGGGLNMPAGIAIDGSGHIWAANSGHSGACSVSEFSSSGLDISGSSGDNLGGSGGTGSLAIDSAGNVWVTHTGGNTGSICEFNSTGSPLSLYTGGGLNDPRGIAIDASGHVWISNAAGDVSEFNSSNGSPLSPVTGYTGGGLSTDSELIAVDESGNVWVPNNTLSMDGVSELDSSGTPNTNSPFTGGGQRFGFSVAIDGSGNVWIPAAGPLIELSSSGVAISGSQGYSDPGAPPGALGVPKRKVVARSMAPAAGTVCRPAGLMVLPKFLYRRGHTGRDSDGCQPHRSLWLSRRQQALITPALVMFATERACSFWT